MSSQMHTHPTLQDSAAVPNDQRQSSKAMPKIAIVGLAVQYPDADTPEQFWQNLLDKKDSRSQIDAAKLNANPADYQGVQGQADRFYCDKGGYIRNFRFDPQGYQLPPTAFDGLDESFLWALDCSKKPCWMRAWI
ncbi:beta-ketoacyl synthase N-terminal-like domain-containing protein [Shewanella seohaensis]|uniref:beta-ketoacyl synthase N-terminal-like domain-containing protein n=1 Tax=Shewanella seohaensis TaxID=755175 RepID=UPI0036F23F34